MRPLLFGCCLLMLACFPARSDLLPPLVSIADTTISDGDGAHVNGAAPDMIVGGLLQFPAPCRGLLRFDLSSLPPTATITSVTLTVSVTISRPLGDQHLHKLRRMLAPWHETEALWNYSGFASWFGGDFAEEDDATRSLGDPGTYTFASTTGLIATVQFWQTNPAANYGWALVSDSEFEDGTARRIATHESIGGQPTLTIGYGTTPPPPANFYVTSPGFGYAINEQEGNPTLTLTRGSNYVFDIMTDPSHPFQIATGPNFGDPAYNNGVSNNNTSSGKISFTVPLNAPDTLYYVCSLHFFGGVINIVDPSSPPAPLVQIVSMDLSSSNVVLRSLGTNGWLAIPEFSSNIVSSNWAVVPNFTNTFANGTNVTVFNRLDPICGPNVFLRVKNTPVP